MERWPGQGEAGEATSVARAEASGAEAGPEAPSRAAEFAANADQITADLYASDWQPLYNLAVVLVGDPEEADNLTVAVLAEFLANLRAGKIERHPRACLYGLLRFRAIDRLRAQARRPALDSLDAAIGGEGGDGGVTLADTVADPRGPEGDPDSRAQLALLWPTLSRVERALVRAIMANRPLKTLVGPLGLSEEVLKKRLQRLRPKLRRWFDPGAIPARGQ